MATIKANGGAIATLHTKEHTLPSGTRVVSTFVLCSNGVVLRKNSFLGDHRFSDGYKRFATIKSRELRHADFLRRALKRRGYDFI